METPIPRIAEKEKVERMPHKIVFLDDGTVTAKRLKRAFSAAGHVCLDAAGEEALRTRLDDAGAEIVVHVPSDPRRLAGILEKVVSERPFVPVLHIMEESLFQAGDWLKTRLMDWMRVTAPVDLVLRRIDTLVHFASLERELTTATETARKMERFTREIRHLDTAPSVMSAMGILAEELEADNAIWFPEDSLHREIERHLQLQQQQQQQPPVISLASSVAARQRPSLWMSLADFPADRIASLFASWRLTEVSEGAMDAGPTEIGMDRAPDVIIPVLPFDAILPASRPYGHIVLVRPRSWRKMSDGSLLRTYFELLSQQVSSTVAHEQLKAMTYKDDLTDLFNQRYLPLVLQQETDRAGRSESEFSVLFLDVDYFKSVNDTKGHLVGSQVLVELSKIFRGSIRRTDYAFRYGGDEYVIVLSGADSKSATLVAERLRQRAASSIFAINGSQVNVTVSIGIATYPVHAKSAEEILTMADEAMYMGKHKSRNVVQIAS